MDIFTKLHLIQEGYSIDQINSGDIRSFSQINESITDELSLFTESITTSLDFMSQINLEMLQESDDNNSNKDGIFKRFINWIVEKIRQFRKFIMDLFKKKRMETVKNQEQVFKTQSNKLNVGVFKPFTIKGTLEKLINSPDNAMSTLDDLLDNFRKELDNIIVNANKGFEHNKIPQDVHPTQFTTIIWKRVIDNSNISYNHDVAQNIVDYVLGGPIDVIVSKNEQVENIFNFGKLFYSFASEIDKTLKHYENTISNLKMPEDIDDSIKLINLANTTLLLTTRTVVVWVDRHIAHALSVAQTHVGK